ncbi:MAG: helix-turn-helix transcriptional regulator, partial [Acidothermales bacterium]|nr:helix-turn-helix transcriptional regulator [Acidothermales bacterium]
GMVLSVPGVTVVSMVEAGARAETVSTAVGMLRADLGATLRLNELADALGYSPFHLTRVFRTVVGVPPGEFRTALRFDFAKRLLLLERLSVTDTCYEVGFDSLGTFSSRFSRLVGVSPAEFQRLPELVHESTPDHVIVRSAGDTRAVVRGTVRAAGCDGPVYVGLFPTSLAYSRPVVGTYLPRPGAFELPAVPLGSYRLLAAGFPAAADAIARLLPDQRTQVGSANRWLRVVTGTERLRADVRLSPLDPDQPPVLVATPALSLPR